MRRRERCAPDVVVVEFGATGPGGSIAGPGEHDSGEGRVVDLVPFGMTLIEKLSAIAAVTIVGGIGVVGTAAAISEESATLEAELAKAGPVSSWVPIESYRAFDSRVVQGDVSERLFSGEFFYLNVTSDEDQVAQIPTDATGVTYNATAVRTSARGFMQIAAPEVEPGSTSTLNWFSENSVIANSGSVQLGVIEPGVTRQLKGCADGGCILVYVGGPSTAATDWFIDITGYYVAN